MFGRQLVPIGRVSGLSIWLVARSIESQNVECKADGGPMSAKESFSLGQRDPDRDEEKKGRKVSRSDARPQNNPP